MYLPAQIVYVEGRLPAMVLTSDTTRQRVRVLIGMRAVWLPEVLLAQSRCDSSDTGGVEVTR